MSLGYQHASPFQNGFLPVGDIHILHYEQYGNPDGKPALFLHGGPGGTTSSSDAAYFNPAVYRVVIFDQRGAGRSTPSAELRENTSQHLVADIEALRMHLGIPKWHLVFGGSWGSSLSLMYTQAHPAVVGSLILRGVFTGRSKELEFHRGSTGAAMLFPKAYAAFLKPLPAEDHLDPVRGYSKLLSSTSADTRLAAARSFNAWDICTSYMEPPENWWRKLDNEKWCMEHAAIECHYFSHGLFVEEGELLRKENIDKIRHIPATIIQGQYDICTPPQTAWDLHQAWPESTLHMVPKAGHSAKEPGTMDQLVKACDAQAQLSL